MSEVERTITVRINPEDAFRYVSSISNLPSFVPNMKSLREDEPNHVFGVGEMEGRTYEISGFLRADVANRRLDWESDGTPGYRGWLRIEEAGQGESRVTVHLSLRAAASETPPPHPGLAGDRLERGLDNAMNRLREQLEQAARPKTQTGR